MSKIAIFPGSFDPFTIGHESIVKKAIPLFDEIIVAIGYNTSKKGFFPVENRKKMIEKIFKDEPKIKIEIYSELTVDYCKKVNAQYILRGLRTATDFEYERAIAQMNRFMKSDVETIFLLTESEHTPISSTIVREIMKFKGDVSNFISKSVNAYDYL